MNYALKTLEQAIANRRNEILQWQEQIKRGGDVVSQSNWESHIKKCGDEIQECENAIKCVELFHGMYSKRTMGLNPNETSFAEYLENWISIKV